MLKKLTVFLLGLTCCMSLVSCGQEETAPAATEEAGIEAEQETEGKTTAQSLDEKITVEISTEERDTEPVTEEESDTDTRLLAVLQQLMDARTYSGDCSIYVADLITGQSAEIDNHQMQAASLIKLYIAGAVFEGVENGILEQTDGVNSQLCIMISESDNDAANALVTLLGGGDAALGMERVNAYCSNYGFENTHMGRLLLAPNDVDDNFTSVKDTSSFLTMVYRNQLPGSTEILSYMKQQQRTAKLPAGIPQGVATANKTGELADVENDAMLVLSDTHPYVICVMSQYLSSGESARTWITGVSSDVYHFYFDGE